jgi:hypothetical protein
MATPLSDTDLASLAIHAQTRNRTLGVTGILFLAGDHFLQILEGDRAPVAWLYGMIVADPRHHEMVKVLDGPLDHRAFEGWFMRLLTDDDITEPARSLVMNALQLSGGAGPHGEAILSADVPARIRALAAALTSGVLRAGSKPHGPPPLDSAA